ncbi:MAG TPA: Pycsar system effector family protein [Puia sp.]|nr:Pycsar system effector family protein [Puia sp.]
MDYATILERTQHYVRKFFDSHVNDKLHYHNLKHTERVVEAAGQIAQHYHLNEVDFFTVSVAAWFHDIGYLTGEQTGHEERGARMAQSYLLGEGLEQPVIDDIRRCIMATQLPQRAVTLTEQIVCDADLYHLGTGEFGDLNKQVRKEAEAVKDRKISKEEWRRSTIRFLEQHQYYTDYCRSLLNKKQAENLEKLREKDPDRGSNPIDNLLHEHDMEVETKEGAESGKEKKGGKKGAGRGIDTVFRISSNNNQRLSSQADSKAHILIQVNSIIISVLLSLLLRKIEDHTNLAIPAVLLLTVNLVTIIFSILATRPRIPPGTFSKADVDEKKVNLLFFGNFYKMSLEDYAAGMLTMMDDRDFLYGSLIRDVYFQGIALGRKYRWLRLSYDVFMYGLIASVAAFLVAALAFPQK